MTRSISPGGAFDRMETILAAAVVVLLSGAVLGPVFDPLQLGGDKIGWLRLLWVPAYIVILALAARRWRELARLWRPALLLAPLIVLAALSLAWSADPASTARRAPALLFTTLFGFWLPTRFAGAALPRFLAELIGLMALAALAVCLLLPGFGLDHDANPGAWRGLWYEKNAMGTTMACGATAACAAAFAAAGRRRALLLLAAILCAGLTLLTRSATSLLVLVAAGAILGLTRLARRGPIAAIAAAWLGVTVLSVAAIWAGLMPDAAAGLLGKDPTITGRTPIWQAAERWASASPWLGYGYEGFWSDTGAAAKAIRDQLGWMVPNAHNSWLDLRLELGWVGVALAAVVFLAAAGAVLARGWRLDDGGWAAAFFATFLIQSLSETLIAEQNTLPWALCVAAIVRLLGPSGGTARAPALIQAHSPTTGAAPALRAA